MFTDTTTTSITFDVPSMFIGASATNGTDGATVKAELEAIEADKRDKRLRKLAKAHRKAWYANPHEADVAGYWATGDTYEVAVANQMADAEIRWRISGRSGSLTFPEFVQHLVDHNVDAAFVLPLG